MLKGLIAGLALILAAGSAGAHHSFAPYDAKTTKTLIGTVGSFHWSNPHVTFTLLVTPAAGKVQEWNIVTSNPSILKRFGWTADSVKPGDHVKVDCNPMSDASYGGRLRTLVLVPSGKILKTKLSSEMDTLP